MKCLIILLCFLLLSCSNPVQHKNEITKVVFARSGAWFDRGAALEIDSSLRYKYYDANQKKYYIGTITARFWDTLNTKFEDIKFKTITAHSGKIIQDANYFEVIIYWKSGKRRITRVWDQPLDSMLTVVEWLNNSPKKAILHEVNYAIKFETTYQNPPPIPNIRRVTFPQPKKSKD
jgi:hypothetical protein